MFQLWRESKKTSDDWYKNWQVQLDTVIVLRIHRSYDYGQTEVRRTVQRRSVDRQIHSQPA